MSCLTFPYLHKDHGFEIVKLDSVSAPIERKNVQPMEQVSTVKRNKKSKANHCPDCNAAGKRQYQDSVKCDNNFHIDKRTLRRKNLDKCLK